MKKVAMGILLGGFLVVALSGIILKSTKQAEIIPWDSPSTVVASTSTTVSPDEIFPLG